MNVNWASKIMVALDYQNASEAEATLKALDGTGCYVKVGMELFYAAGPQFVVSLKERGYRVFLDLKMHDIPNTVKGGAKSITRLGVDMFNIHVAGGVAMMEAAMEGVAMASLSDREAPLVIGVTQLTSTDERTMNEEIGIPGRVEQVVLRYAELANRAGLNGVVCSPLEVPSLKQRIGQAFVTVTPGIRPKQGSSLGDQKRVATPSEAFHLGSDYIVVGRPITQAEDVREAFEGILNEIVKECVPEGD